MTSTDSSHHRALVVAGRSADSLGIVTALRLHRATAPTSFTLLVPATPHGFAWATDMSSGWTEAAARAERAATRIRGAGLEVAETIVGDPDPVDSPARTRASQRQLAAVAP